MKKIIELAEKVCEQYHNSLTYELAEAIKARKELEQTPITEEWLKEHGWVNDKDDRERMAIYIGNDLIEWIIPTHYLYLFRNEKVKWIHPGIAAVTLDGIATLADLYDAAELCGINLED